MINVQISFKLHTNYFSFGVSKVSLNWFIYNINGLVKYSEVLLWWLTSQTHNSHI